MVPDVVERIHGIGTLPAGDAADHDERFLHDGFRMRFQQQGHAERCPGPLAHRLRAAGREQEFQRHGARGRGLGLIREPLLQTYTAVPFKAFEQSPASYMAGNVVN